MLKSVFLCVLLFSILPTSGCSSLPNSSIATNTFRDKNPEKVAKIEKIIQQQLSRLNNSNSHQKPVLLKDYGVPIRNPFSKLPEDTKQTMIKAGIDIQAMSSYKARYMSGSLAGASALTIINADPQTILVIGTGTVTHDGIYSRGPIVAVGDVHLMDALYSKDLVWYGEAASGGDPNIGLPIVRNSGKDKGVTFGVSPYSVKEEVAANIQLGAKKTGKALLKDNFKEVANPLKTISAEQKVRLKKRDVNVEHLANFKAVVFAGSDHEDILNDDPQTLLVIKEGWGSGNVISAGPVISYKERIGDTQLSASMFWFASPKVSKDSISSRDDIRGMPLIVDKE
ncbi:MAG: Unknown protein [uncultured Thiotrichaceae bacterium]|uniref:Uncharacterized protein n=1 Tax=uncultured Thiotrichaceae bacterium TaxID=298394 RepID=A0A6S6TL54_9GAMM|nr:MAG: Unknown protein [uncultured Thiotrichaceae bacterium]